MNPAAPPIRWSPALLLVPAIAAACSEGKAAPKATAKVDTLPSGQIQVTSPVPTGWVNPEQGWRFQDAGTVGGADGSSDELVEPGTMGVDAQGRIYVTDHKPAVVKVFDSTGALVRTIGHEGSGPGEFRVAFIAVRGSFLVVHDPQQSRTSVFDTSGSYLRSWKSSCCYWDDIFLDREMRIYIPTVGTADSAGKVRWRLYARYGIDGHVIDTLRTPAREEGKTWSVRSKDGKSSMITGVPFTPQMVTAYVPAGGFLYGWSGDYRLALSPRGNDTSQTWTRPWTPEPVPNSLRESATNETLKSVIEQYGEATAKAAIKSSDVPATGPAFTTLRVDEDGNAWVRRFAGSDSTKTGYDVFGPDGSWLGGLTIPAGIREYGGQLFAKGMIYAVVDDDEGRPRIKRFRVIR